jgi:hypothetical protein
MNRTILAVLFTVALTGPVRDGGWKNFDASAEAVVEARNDPVLPPVAAQTNHAHRGVVAHASGTPGNLGHIHATPLNLAAFSIVSLRHNIKTFLDTRIEENCLTTAVYFEARSESMVGQLAVATVILNRVKASNSHPSICGVVYRGASHLNACQFSFACDGKPNLVDDTRAWNTAYAVTELALANDRKKNKPLQILATATNYHADYVDPVWSKSLNRLTQIGHHIFYSQI